MNCHHEDEPKMKLSNGKLPFCAFCFGRDIDAAFRTSLMLVGITTLTEPNLEVKELSWAG